ncbi:DEAD/DEAH box helicase [Umezakia ovalisporum]|uniref:DEAD/DEAH box helicase n=1 Tax=Umezakia ovalisporum TaxID=75695 RepID=UPI002473A799|nr:DEAD/DEAH box helicase [Umezakia ovalisporum]MDH6086668.1 DEAD/DEAH box helicase [Umezakia ovalisporum TAC611]
MLNPILYTEKVISDFLRYQLTTYPFADSNLYQQMRTLLNLEETRATPLFQGPYISLNRSFRQGEKIDDLISQNILHPHLKNIAPYQNVYYHQELAIKAITSKKTTIVSTGTGSGKTECFLYPIISRCLQLRDENAPEGIVAVIVYPMNALAEDQLGRLRELLAGSGISFGMYVGKTPENTADAPGKQLKPGASKKDYEEEVKKAKNEKQNYAIYPPEERISRAEMRTQGKQPRILLTNINQLELLLTRQKDVQLFNDVKLEYLVFDEAHTFTGATGAETACLIRRLRAFCGKNTTDTTCIATSATIVDPEPGSNAGAEFAARFFGVSQDNVEMVTEKYEPNLWANSRQTSPPLPGNPAVCLKNILDALSDKKQPGELIKIAYGAMTNQVINCANWEEELYQQLASNELVFQMASCLRNPRLLTEFIADLERRVERKVSESEILCWLALGASARKENRPLLRPVVHGFVRGVSGAVVTFPVGREGGVREKSKSTNYPSPKLWLSAEDATNDKDSDELYRLPVMTCTTCGQHYFNHHVADFSFFGKFPGGGQAVGNNQVIWPPLAEENGGKRVVLLDRLITNEEEREELDDNHPKSTVPLHLCRYCGTLHSDAANRCYNCGRKGKLVPLLAVRQKDKTPGRLSSCVACQSLGRWVPGGYREPAREVRATAVSDVHVLAQNMLQYAERKRLLVFADNRQDAAFQAGWMQDHARRFRLRSLMYERIQQSAVSLGDLTAHLDDILEADDDLSRALIPEVWRVARKEAEGVRHSEERRYFLRIQVLREIAAGVKQRIGLEPWGRLKIEYGGLSNQHPFFAKWSSLLGIKTDELVDGIASLLDITRRSNILLDREGKIFSQLWQAGEKEIQRGYLPLMAGIPKGLKLRRDPSDDANRIIQWLSDKGDTLPRQVAKKWGIDQDIINDFYRELWQLLTADLSLLVPVTLTGKSKRALPHCAGAMQIDVDKLRLTPHQGVYRCNTCRRVHLRPTPKMSCMAWRCNGTIKFEQEDPDDYNLMVLDQPFMMIRPREHSAQVPTDERETLERMFKSDSELVNTLVCTPTLELGVNIGVLDAVLMRNVPPLPANYKQRAGRAGRQHRMAVNLTYARQASHDRAYYNDPLKLLQGSVYPPGFNLRNPLMVEKHVHAAVLTILNQLVRSSNHLTSDERQEIFTTLGYCFPNQVKSYLFDNNGNVRTSPLDVSVLNTIISKHQIYLFERVREIFSQNWPPTDAFVVKDDTLNNYITNTQAALSQVIQRVWKRLQWALREMKQLEDVRQCKGTLDPDEEALKNRCDRLIKKLKGIQSQKKREAEGYDDTNTYSVLAAEGFLPGYGLDVGSVLATAQIPRTFGWMPDFELPRPSAIALREYIPGNLIYANGNRFIPRFFHLEPQQQPVLFQVDVANEALVEIGTQVPGSNVGLGVASLRAIPICDVNLPHQSQISDDEDYRFQMPVSLYGYEQNRHNGGRAYFWQDKTVQLRQGVHLRLVNVGAAKLVRSGKENLGYPVCLVCGQSRSPFSSEEEIRKFKDEHLARCGKEVQPTGFFADVVADTLSLQNCENREIAYSIVEAIRLGAANILDMEVEDLQILIIAHPGKEIVDALLYDPMPGGSGLLDQIISRWLDVITGAQEVVAKCPSACKTSCVDCLQTFRNAHYHRHLNRHTAAKKLNYWGDNLTFTHDIPPVLPVVTNKSQQPVNDQETILQNMLLRAGFPQPITQHPLDLGKPLGMTTPDFFYIDPTEKSEGICIYLDGMSEQLHGNPDRQQRDRIIREKLRNRDFEVFEIPVTSLTDIQAMVNHFSRIARVLLGKQKAREIRDNPGWFD